MNFFAGLHYTFSYMPHTSRTPNETQSGQSSLPITMPSNVYHTICTTFIIYFVTLIQTQGVAFSDSDMASFIALSFAIGSLC